MALALSGSAAPALAVNRAPQVPIQGTALQQLLDGFGQAIDVNTDQQVLPVFAGYGPNGERQNLLIRKKVGDGALWVYSAGGIVHTRCMVHPEQLPAGWFTVALLSAQLVTVAVLDDREYLRELTEHSGITTFELNLAISDAHGMFYADDVRNPGSAARLIAFQGTGAKLFDLWIAAETDGDGDFDDALFLLEGMSAVPVQRARWGALKQRFR
jgi:hypothetical protein